MNIKTAFPSKFLKADELLDGDLTVTIRDVKIEDVGSTKQEEKPVLYFEETEKGVVCNKTNSTTITKLYGDETDNWIGKQIVLFATEVDFQGEQVLAIRVRMRKPAAAAPNGGSAAPASPKVAAWTAFVGKTREHSDGDRRDQWLAALDQFFGHHDSNQISDSAWKTFTQVLDKWTVNGGIPMSMRHKPSVQSPIGDVPEFKEDEIPI